MTQPSTIPYYEDRRKWLLYRVLRSNTDRLPRLHGLLLDKLLWCERCLEIKRWNELELHHENGGGDPKRKLGGWQAFYANLEDFEAGCDLVVLCKECHCEVDPQRKKLGY
ncbi:MAG: hypothetical protein SVV03_02655 [Candidatus Nanohaloarchaea archaeon]|nr:hypothetical protein [Candidatus Nanohaloarchaea archaeon]